MNIGSGADSEIGEPEYELFFLLEAHRVCTCEIYAMKSCA